MAENLFAEHSAIEMLVLSVLYMHRPNTVPMEQLQSEMAELILEHGSIEAAATAMLTEIRKPPTNQ